jgi:hypothetical protein
MLAQHFIAMVPPEASVSSQSKLVPHMSQRLNIYMFPYADTQADYILLDLRGDIYPYATRQAYQHEVNRVLQSGNYRILAAQDGYLLLKHALPLIHRTSASGSHTTVALLNRAIFPGRFPGRFPGSKKLHALGAPM